MNEQHQHPGWSLPVSLGAPQRPGCAGISASSEHLPENTKANTKAGWSVSQPQASSLTVGFSRESDMSYPQTAVLTIHEITRRNDLASL